APVLRVHTNFFFVQADYCRRNRNVTGVQSCALPLSRCNPPPDGDADGLRRTVRQRVAAGADVIKILGSKSIREGGGPTLSEDELRAACGEAKAHGRRCVVHAHAAEAARRAVLAGATSIEHGEIGKEWRGRGGTEQG